MCLIGENGVLKLVFYFGVWATELWYFWMRRSFCLREVPLSQQPLVAHRCRQIHKYRCSNLKGSTVHIFGISRLKTRILHWVIPRHLIQKYKALQNWICIFLDCLCDLIYTQWRASAPSHSVWVDLKELTLCFWSSESGTRCSLL